MAVTYGGPARADVRLGVPGGGNRDFVLRYRLSGDKIESGLLLWEGEGGGGRRENFFALMMEPPQRPTAAQIPARVHLPARRVGSLRPRHSGSRCSRKRATTRRSPHSAGVFHAGTGLPLGATGTAQPALASLPAPPAAGEIAIAVVGAHLTGMPLNGELKSFGARFLQRTTTTADYRLFLSPGTAPAKPGLLRVGADAGVAVDVEIWTMPAEQFGRFVASIPAPLSIGTLTITDGRDVKGFLVEAEATRDARDISAFGGWRNFMEQMKVSA